MSDHAKAPASGSTPRQATGLGRAIRGAFAIPAAFGRAGGSSAPAGRRILAVAVAVLAVAAVLGATSASAVAPVVTADNATEVAYTTAKVSGTVDSSEQTTSWRFQVATQPDFSDALDGPGGTIDSGAPTVKGKFTGLAPDTTYYLRLLAENADGTESDEAAETFKTKAVEAPTVSGVKATNVEFTRAKAVGTVSLAEEDPGFNASCRFEYVSDEDFIAEGFAGAAATPCEPATVEATSPNPVGVKAQFTGLTPDTTYHLRLVAANPGGETKVEAASTFTTGTVTPPTVENLEVSAVTGTSAHFSAEISPNAPGASEGDPAFDITWHFECTPACHGLKGGSIPGDDTAHTVENDVDQLEPNTATYTVWIVAENGFGQTSQEFTTFSTPGAAPTVHAFAAGPVQSDQVDLNGEVNPHNSPTTYWFEWGTSDCSANPCTALPASKDADAGDGPYFAYATEHLGGLQPDTTYHFRLVAANANGTTEGPDEEFTTAAAEPACANAGALGTGFLPNCRAWEMVSPPDKNGIDVIAQTDKTHISAEGNAVTFSALGIFGDVKGSTFDEEYLARRTAVAGTNGWATHGINPETRPATVPAATSTFSTYVNAFSPDLSAAVFQSRRRLTDAPNVADVSNLYRVSGLSQGTPNPELLTDSVNEVPTSWPTVITRTIKPTYVDAAIDLSHVFFQSRLPLTADAPSQGGFCVLFGLGCPLALYENADGEVRLVGRVPPPGESECDDATGPACESAPSSQSGLNPEAGFYAQKMVSSDGRRAFFEAGGNIFLREDGERTYQLNVSETEPSAPPQGAGLWDASEDGSRVFFSSSTSLTADDHDSSPDLYMYEVEKSAGHRLTLVSASSVADGYFEGFLGASEDGRDAYFVSDDRLIPGQPPSSINGLYRWHDGELAFVGNIGTLGLVRINGPQTVWNLVNTTKTSRVSPDGRHLLFMTQDDTGLRGRGGFAAYDHAGYRELYLYSADSGRLACATCDPSGAPGKSDALIDVREGAATSASTSDSAHVLSDDGRFVFFNTAQGLLPGDTNDKNDAYQYDSRTAALRLISSGTSPVPSYLIDASDDGRDVFFATRERLSAWDTDGAYDLYDARIGGGLPEPDPVPAPCIGDSCRNAVPPAPANITPGSESASPPPPVMPCAKGKHRVRRHGRYVCVKNPRKHHKHNRTADNDRRAGK